MKTAWAKGKTSLRSEKGKWGMEGKRARRSKKVRGGFYKILPIGESIGEWTKWNERRLNTIEGLSNQ